MQTNKQNGGFLMTIILVIVAIVVLKFVFHIDIVDIFNYVSEVVTFVWHKVSGIFN